jgi:hypothetical protein
MEKNTETIYEEIFAYASSASSCDGDNDLKTDDGLRLRVYLIANSRSAHKNVYFSFRSWLDNEYLIYKDYFDSIQKYSTLRIYRIGFRKDTLRAFYLPVIGTRIDLNANTGSMFKEETYRGKAAVFESQIFDTVFNDVLHVKRCHLYTIVTEFDNCYDDEDIFKWYFYYDVDRCIFAQVELLNLETNNLVYIRKVRRINVVDSAYFNKIWNKATGTDSIVMPLH